MTDSAATGSEQRDDLSPRVDETPLAVARFPVQWRPAALPEGAAHVPFTGDPAPPQRPGTNP